jgi:hypothetical protein
MASLTSDQRDAFCEAAVDGIHFDGLHAETTNDGYRFEAGLATESGLDEAGLRRCAEQASDYVANWYFWKRIVDTSDAGRAFLRWLERVEASSDGADTWSVPERHDRLADGMDRKWGELCITASLETDGRRRYQLRHVDDGNDGGDATTGLDLLAGRRELADRIRYDDRGRYRPLKTAPSLPTGWRLEDLDWSDVLDAVGVVYPATVENWHREQQGTLDVEHYRETAERQTGIYDEVEELPRDALEWVAEACCVDSQCLKRRRWDEAPDDELDVPRGDGAFPCREPCSVLIAAARKWTQLEREAAQTYEFELTPSEKAQLEAIVEAVAEGRVDEIREADLAEGANRYRVRYLRAKRFGEGELPE